MSSYNGKQIKAKNLTSERGIFRRFRRDRIPYFFYNIKALIFFSQKNWFLNYFKSSKKELPPKHNTIQPLQTHETSTLKIFKVWASKSSFRGIFDYRVTRDHRNIFKKAINEEKFYFFDFFLKIVTPKNLTNLQVTLEALFARSLQRPLSKRLSAVMGVLFSVYFCIIKYFFSG